MTTNNTESNTVDNAPHAQRKNEAIEMLEQVLQGLKEGRITALAISYEIERKGMQAYFSGNLPSNCLLMQALQFTLNQNMQKLFSHAEAMEEAKD